MEKIKQSRLDPIVSCRVYSDFMIHNAVMTVQTRFNIGEVAKQSGVAVGALRYYEGLGLLYSERGENGYRDYTAQTIPLVQFIKKAQSLGFSLEDIHEVLSIHHNGNEPATSPRPHDICPLIETISLHPDS
jgi:DNA-binding transcriptional MerR regulator